MSKSVRALGGDSLGRAFNLTNREIQVLRLLWKGGSNKAIARDLFLTENTIETHLRRIYEKLGSRNRTQALPLPAKRAQSSPGRQWHGCEQSSDRVGDLSGKSPAAIPALSGANNRICRPLLFSLELQIRGPLARASTTRRASVRQRATLSV